MSDLLVKLYNLPDITSFLEEQKSKGIEIRRALPPEKHIVVRWVKQVFSEGWASEVEVAFSKHPVSCFVAIENEKLIGFACYDATCKNFFGPVGISKKYRGRGIGKSLLLRCLYTMKEKGYAYAIIGGVGKDNIEFYNKTVGAVLIKDSEPGIYRGMLSNISIEGEKL